MSSEGFSMIMIKENNSPDLYFQLPLYIYGILSLNKT
jgi:hypothetical protein